MALLIIILIAIIAVWYYQESHKKEKAEERVPMETHNTLQDKETELVRLYEEFQSNSGFQFDMKGILILDEDGYPLPKYDGVGVGKVLDTMDSLGGGNSEVKNRMLGQTEEMEEIGEKSNLQKRLHELREQHKKWSEERNPKEKKILEIEMSRASCSLLNNL